jgi:hypothetical protein
MRTCDCSGEMPLYKKDSLVRFDGGLWIADVYKCVNCQSTQLIIPGDNIITDFTNEAFNPFDLHRNGEIIILNYEDHVKDAELELLTFPID